MIPLLSGSSQRIAWFVAAVLLAFSLDGCARPQASATIADPLEGVNRGFYNFNVGLDKNVLRPMAKSVGGNGRSRFFDSVGHFAVNIDEPLNVANDLLQFRLGDALHNTLRFGINTIIGLGGFFDPATEIGLADKNTDFGETLYRWGAGAGPYLVLPVYGPSNLRDTVGLVVDNVFDPMQLLVKRPVLLFGTGTKLLDKFGSRIRHSATVDSLLYDSADGYGQLKLLSQQNRQYELGQTPADEAFIDPYGDSNGQ